MPVIKSAKKKLRKDVKRTFANKKVKIDLKALIKKAKETPSAEAVQLAVKKADKAAKKHIIHGNKAARIKSRLAKLLSKLTPEKTASANLKIVKKTPKKQAK